MQTQRKPRMLRLYAAVSAFAALTAFFFQPLDVYYGNQTDFEFGAGLVLGPFALMALAVGLGCFALLWLAGRLRPALGRTLALLGFGAALAVYLQGYFLGLGGAVFTGVTPDFQPLGVSSLLNLALWLVLIALPTAAWALWRQRVLKPVALLCCALIAMQGASLTAQLIGDDGKADDKYLMSTKGEFALSDENIIVFMLDNFGEPYLEELMANAPEAAEILDGFTHYDNVTGTYPWTDTAFTAAFYGATTRNELPYLEWYRQAASADTLWPAMKDMGWRLYMGVSNNPTTVSFTGEQQAVYDNLERFHAETTDHPRLLKLMLRLTAYRFAPEIARPVLYKERFQYHINNCITYQPEGEAAFSKNNARFYADLGETGLSVADEKSFHLYFLPGTHAPYLTDAQCNAAEENTVTVQDAARGCLTLLDGYFRQLKALNLYEDATLIVMADHGSHENEVTTNPIFLMKPAGQTGPLQTSHAPVSYADFRATVFAAAGGDPAAYGTPVSQWREGDTRERLFYQYPSVRSMAEGVYLPTLVEYAADADGALQPTGKRFEKGGR